MLQNLFHLMTGHGVDTRRDDTIGHRGNPRHRSLLDNALVEQSDKLGILRGDRVDTRTGLLGDGGLHLVILDEMKSSYPRKPYPA